MPYLIEIHRIADWGRYKCWRPFLMVLIYFRPSHQIGASFAQILQHENLHNAFDMQCTINKNVKKWSLHQSKYFSLITLSRQMGVKIFGKQGKVHNVDLSQLSSAAKEAQLIPSETPCFQLVMTWWSIQLIPFKKAPYRDCHYSWSSSWNLSRRY